MTSKNNNYAIYLIVFAISFLMTGNVYAKTMHLHPSATGTKHDNHYYEFWQILPVAPGDIIYCHDDGTTYNYSFSLDGWKGTADQPITIMTALGETPVINNGYIDILNSQYIEIKGLTVTGSQYAGIMLQQGSHHITVTDCIVKNNGGGIWIGNGAGTSNKILNNEVSSNQTQGIAADHINCTPGNETIMSGNHVYDNGYMGFEISSNYYIVEKNVVHNNGKDYAGSSGIHLFAFSPEDDAGDNNIIRYNISYKNIELDGPDGNGIQLDQWCDNNMVYYNLCYSNDGAGINIYDSSGNTIYNNTLYGNMIDPGTSHLLKAELTLASDYSHNIDGTKENTITNNIITATGPSVYAIYIDELTSDNQINIRRNLFFQQKNSPIYWINKNPGNSIKEFNNILGYSENLVQDPLFIVQFPQKKLNFSLQNGSPAVDYGINLNQLQDILGKKISGTGADLGAFETETDDKAPVPPMDLKAVETN